MIVAQTNKDAGRFRDEAFVDTSASTVMQPIGGNTDLLFVEKPVSTVVGKSISTLVGKPVSALVEKPISSLVKSKVTRLLELSWSSAGRHSVECRAVRRRRSSRRRSMCGAAGLTV